jgi:hypothetical protein
MDGYAFAFREGTPMNPWISGRIIEQMQREARTRAHHERVGRDARAAADDRRPAPATTSAPKPRHRRRRVRLVPGLWTGR